MRSLIGQGMESGTARAGLTPAQAKRLSSVFLRAADVLDHSAGLAEEHAARCAQLGRSDHAAGEREAAQKAHAAARRARAQAATWEQLHRELDERERRGDERNRTDQPQEDRGAERDRTTDEHKRIADAQERAADEHGPRVGDDQARPPGTARQRSQDARRHAEEALERARARVSRLAAERVAREEGPPAEG